MQKFILPKPFLISIVTIIVSVIAYLFGVPFLDLMELKTIDLRFESRGELDPSPEVVLAVIDEKSLENEGKWVWPRAKFAALVEKLSAAGTRVIAFDVGFLEPDDTTILQAIDKIKIELGKTVGNHATFREYLQTLRTESDNDQLLADAIAGSNAQVVLGYFFQMSEESARHLDPDEILVHEENIQTSGYKLVRFAAGGEDNLMMASAAAPQSNITTIARASEHAGFFNMEPDSDGVVRWMFGAIEFEDMIYSPLSLAAASAYLQEPLALSVDEIGTTRIRLGRQTIPTDDSGRILINYRGPEKTFPHISITDILHDDVPVAQLKDKIVIVGATTVGIYDMRVTPFGSVFPGLEIHANVISSVLSRNFLFQPSWALLFDIMAMVLLGLFLGVVLGRSGVITGALTALVLFGGYIAICLYFFSYKGWILNLVYPLSLIVLLYVGITAYRYLAESRQKKFIRDAFSTYLAPSVVKKLIESPENLDLGGEEREITAFFSDVQGFTSISESLTPKALVELLNEFLTEMTDIVLLHEGTVDKFEGDAIIAFFGAPNELPNHARTACQACVDMQLKLADLRQKWQAEGRPELKMRIGLCTGPAVVGNMGSVNRMDYTMMGDTVNTAARLEGVNKIYGIYTLISESTRQLAGDDIVAREVDSIMVVGKNEPVAVYEVMGNPGRIPAEVNAVLEKYARGLAAYRSRQWDQARQWFEAVLEIDPHDGPAKTMIDRCMEFEASPPEADWNGAYTMKSK